MEACVEYNRFIYSLFLLFLMYGLWIGVLFFSLKAVTWRNTSQSYLTPFYCGGRRCAHHRFQVPAHASPWAQQYHVPYAHDQMTLWGLLKDHRTAGQRHKLPHSPFDNTQLRILKPVLP